MVMLQKAQHASQAPHLLDSEAGHADTQSGHTARLAAIEARLDGIERHQAAIDEGQAARGRPLYGIEGSLAAILAKLP